MIILLFGQPASGKTTLSNALYEEIWADSLFSVVRIDGDKWRDVTKNTDYSKEGRLRNLKGAFDMALYLERDGYIPMLSFVTPYQELRQYLKDNCKKLLQIYLTYNEDRGRNMNFAKDFEEPPTDCLHIDTSSMSISEAKDKILEYIFQNTKIENGDFK